MRTLSLNKIYKYKTGEGNFIYIIFQTIGGSFSCICCSLGRQVSCCCWSSTSLFDSSCICYWYFGTTFHFCHHLRNRKENWCWNSGNRQKELWSSPWCHCQVWLVICMSLLSLDYPFALVSLSGMIGYFYVSSFSWLPFRPGIIVRYDWLFVCLFFLLTTLYVGRILIKCSPHQEHLFLLFFFFCFHHHIFAMTFYFAKKIFYHFDVYFFFHDFLIQRLGFKETNLRKHLHLWSFQTRFLLGNPKEVELLRWNFLVIVYNCMLRMSFGLG